MRIEVLKTTHENWHGSYVLEDNYHGVKNQQLLKVIFNGCITYYDPKLKPVWRTCVWGNDDFGMEYDCDTKAEAWEKFLEVIRMKFVGREELRKLGFVPA